MAQVKTLPTTFSSPHTSISTLIQKAFFVPTHFQEQQYLKNQWRARWWLSVVSFNEAPSNTASNITAFTFFISLLYQWSAHHEEQSVEQPPCCCGLPLGPSGQWAAFPTQPASPGRWHGRSTNGVRWCDLSELERKTAATELQSLALPPQRCLSSCSVNPRFSSDGRSIPSSIFLTLLLLLLLPRSLISVPCCQSLC